MGNLTEAVGQLMEMGGGEVYHGWKSQLVPGFCDRKKIENMLMNTGAIFMTNPFEFQSCSIS